MGHETRAYALMGMRIRGLRQPRLRCTLLLLTSLLCPGLFLPQGTARARAEENNADEGPRVLFRVAGPNDGEPINCKIKLNVQTSYTERGILVILVNERELTKRPLFQSGVRIEDDIFSTDVIVDVRQAAVILREDFLSPDAGPVRITIQLLSPEKKFVTSYLWSGFVGKPWIELLPGSASGEDLAARALISPKDDAKSVASGGAVGTSSTSAQLVIHPMKQDMLFLLVAAPRRDLLTLTPDDPQLLKEGRLVETGMCTLGKDGKFERIVVDAASLSSLPWKETYFVLWTYDSKGSWKRSVISALAATK